MRIGVAHHVTALIFYNITRCYGKHVAVFTVAVAAGDIIKYQSFIYGSFVWGIHVRYNKLKISSRKYWNRFLFKRKCLVSLISPQSQFRQSMICLRRGVVLRKNNLIVCAFGVFM